MPELPEVETFVRALRSGTDDAPSIMEMTITGAEVLWPGVVAEPSAAAFKKRITGQHLLDIGRRAKYLRFQLHQDTLLLHLRMSGDLLVLPTNAPLYKHTRLVLHFDNDWKLVFNDPRKFGRVWLLSDPQPVLGKLGPEPLDPSFTAAEFHQMLSNRSRHIKPLLLEQTFVAGIGNIYTDEALHLAKIHPLTPANSLTAQQAAELLAAIRQVLQAGIQNNGASIDWVYRDGEFQNHFRVYARKDEPCPVCGQPIQKIVVAQRGTHICPGCQPGPAS